MAQERRRAELVGGLVALPRTARRLRGLPVASKPLLPLLQRLPWDGNQRPAVRAEGYLTLKASQVDAQPESLRELWQAAGRALLEAVPWAEWSAVAVTKDFRGSPHVDQNDLGETWRLKRGSYTGPRASERLALEGLRWPKTCATGAVRHVAGRLPGRRALYRRVGRVGGAHRHQGPRGLHRWQISALGRVSEGERVVDLHFGPVFSRRSSVSIDFEPYILWPRSRATVARGIP